MASGKQQELDNPMEFREPGFWVALVIALICVAVFVLWLWHGGRGRGVKG
jgi:ABC-type multidrug transport system permease subunit